MYRPPPPPPGPKGRGDDEGESAGGDGATTGKTFAPPPGTFAPREARPALEGENAPPAIKVLSLFRAIPRSVEIAIACAGLVAGSLAIKSEMRYMALDAVTLETVGQLNRMTVPVKDKLIAELKREGYEITPDEIQLVHLVKYDAQRELTGPVQAIVTIQSPRTGYFHQSRFLNRTVGRGGFEVVEDPSKVWPAPSTSDDLRLVFLVGGFVVALLFGAKALLTSRD